MITVADIYVPKYTEIEAKLWHPSDVQRHLEAWAWQIIDWVSANRGDAVFNWGVGGDKPRIFVHTSGQWQTALPGYYVVKGSTMFAYNGREYRHFYTCPPANFEKKWQLRSVAAPHV